MATRADATDIIAITGTSRDSTQIEPYISAANSLVDELLLDQGYSDAILKQIEIWLAAHFLAIRDPQIASEQTNNKNVSYLGLVGLEGLKQTRFGTQVMMFDYKGILMRAAASKGPIDIEALP